MTSVQALYQTWSTDPYFDEKTRQELLAIKDDAKEIEDRFYQYLNFGTAGLRGVIGAGTNRINDYTVALASFGFAAYIENLGEEAKRRGVVISYDSRHYSDRFAEITACIFAAHGITARLFTSLHPVPLLSFAVRHYQCIGGVMITASHNPKQYNGFKAYGEDGSQLPPDAADIVLAEMRRYQDVRELSWPTKETALRSGYLIEIGEELDDAYMAQLQTLSIHPELIRQESDMKIVYTPLHGAGNKPVQRILKTLGFENVFVVKSQEEPDPDFSTVAMPNPEAREALTLAIELADQVSADLVIANDPDADRTGVAFRKTDGTYEVLTGNQIGLLLMDYILSAKTEQQTLEPNSFVATTIVSTKLTRKIAAHYGVKLYEVLTGFKFIGELIKNFDENGDQHFQFGFEESFGYLAGTAVRDKDAVVASMLLAEMAAVARAKQLTFADLVDQIYQKYGYAKEETVSLTMSGKSGLDQIADCMTKLREKGASGFSKLPIRVYKDYKKQVAVDCQTGKETPIDLPQSNVLLYELDGINWFCIRPSGTEPKIKIYYGVYGPDQDALATDLEKLKNLVNEVIQPLLAS